MRPDLTPKELEELSLMLRAASWADQPRFSCVRIAGDAILAHQRTGAILRGAVLGALSQIDPNGCYSDEDCLAEFDEVLSTETALIQLRDTIIGEINLMEDDF